MNNREYLESLSPEELVQTIYFDCPYSFKDRQDHNICKKNAFIEKLANGQQISGFIFSGKQREICNQCKVNWLSAERR